MVTTGYMIIAGLVLFLIALILIIVIADCVKLKNRKNSSLSHKSAREYWDRNNAIRDFYTNDLDYLKRRSSSSRLDDAFFREPYDHINYVK